MKGKISELFKTVKKMHRRKQIILVAALILIIALPVTAWAINRPGQTSVTKEHENNSQTKKTHKKEVASATTEQTSTKPGTQTENQVPATQGSTPTKKNTQQTTTPGTSPSQQSTSQTSPSGNVSTPPVGNPKPTELTIDDIAGPRAISLPAGATSATITISTKDGRVTNWQPQSNVISKNGADNPHAPVFFVIDSGTSLYWGSSVSFGIRANSSNFVTIGQTYWLFLWVNGAIRYPISVTITN